MSQPPQVPINFAEDPTPTVEVDRREAVTAALTEQVRELVDACIRTTVDDDEVRAVEAEVATLVARLRASQLPGPAGVRYNSEGRSWGWGNAVVGRRNAVAPPLTIVHPDAGSDPGAPSYAEVVLGAAYEGPPGMVHGGVSALLLDQIMGETASGFRRLTMTGTLTLRYRSPLPLGPVRLEARIVREDGRKVTVEATIGPHDPAAAPGAARTVAVEATGLFLVPRWAMEQDPEPEPAADLRPGERSIVWRRSAEG
ncbi:PaaI family thioesterase [Nocardioides sp.]|uniref:PaaI family thioesterase n=1 Tax=Nocardioides sp. TaxID=35761 RepID=UPI003512EB31